MSTAFKIITDEIQAKISELSIYSPPSAYGAVRQLTHRADYFSAFESTLKDHQDDFNEMTSKEKVETFYVWLHASINKGLMKRAGLRQQAFKDFWVDTEEKLCAKGVKLKQLCKEDTWLLIASQLFRKSGIPHSKLSSVLKAIELDAKNNDHVSFDFSGYTFEPPVFYVPVVAATPAFNIEWDVESYSDEEEFKAKATSKKRERPGRGTAPRNILTTFFEYLGAVKYAKATGPIRAEQQLRSVCEESSGDAALLSIFQAGINSKRRAPATKVNFFNTVDALLSKTTNEKVSTLLNKLKAFAPAASAVELPKATQSVAPTTPTVTNTLPVSAGTENALTVDTEEVTHSKRARALQPIDAAKYYLQDMDAGKPLLNVIEILEGQQEPDLMVDDPEDFLVALDAAAVPRKTVTRAEVSALLKVFVNSSEKEGLVDRIKHAKAISDLLNTVIPKPAAKPSTPAFNLGVGAPPVAASPAGLGVAPFATP